LDSNKLALKSDFVAALGLADVESTEVLEEVLVTHPESAIIILKFGIQNLFDVRGPESTLSAPSTVPLEHTPLVSYVNQFMAVYFSCLDDGIGVS